MNLMAPGLGFWGMARWKRGVCFFLPGLGAFFWAFWAVIYPLVYNVMLFITDKHQQQEMIFVKYIQLLLAIFTLAVIWIWSYIDLLKELRKEPDSGHAAPTDEK